jgi:hypothetical protein
MDIFPSLKSSIAMGVIIAAGLVGAQVVIHPGIVSALLGKQLAASVSSNEPSASLRQSVILENVLAANLHFTLANFETYIASIGGVVEWETTSDTSFVMRVTRYDALTEQTNLLGFQFTLNDKIGLPNLDQQPSAGSIQVVNMAVNGQVMPSSFTQAMFYQYQSEIVGLKLQGKL